MFKFRLHTPYLIPHTSRLLVWLLLMIVSFNCYAAYDKSVLSVKTDKTLGQPASPGLVTLTDALSSKNIDIEKVSRIKEARGKWIIVMCLASGSGEATRLLKTTRQSLPQTPEALTVWKDCYG